MSAVFQYGGVPNLNLMRAPNRFRKLLIDLEKPKHLRNEDGIDFNPWHPPHEDKNTECIAMQMAEFPSVPGKPIGFTVTLDNDLALAWDLEV
jgi:hypothetical protein